MALDVNVGDAPGLAILDVGLGTDTTSAPVAQRLPELSIPFMFVSACDRDPSIVLRTFGDAPSLTRPVKDPDLLATVDLVLTQTRSTSDRPASVGARSIE